MEVFKKDYAFSRLCCKNFVKTKNLLWQEFELCNYSKDLTNEDNPLFDGSLGNS